MQSHGRINTWIARLDRIDAQLVRILDRRWKDKSVLFEPIEKPPQIVSVRKRPTILLIHRLDGRPACLVRGRANRADCLSVD